MGILSRHNSNTIVLYDRSDTSYIFCKVQDPGGNWHRKSTHKLLEPDALKVAEEWSLELRFLHDRGLATKRRTFSAVADLYLKELQEEVDAGFKKQRQYDDYKPIITRYLKGFFGRKHIDLIKTKDLAEYYKWRATYYTAGPGADTDQIEYELNGKPVRRSTGRQASTPAHSTRNTETVIIRAIFNTALRHEFITNLQMPQITVPKQKSGSNNQRPHFTLEEYDSFIQFLHEWASEPDAKDKPRRQLLKNFVVFVAHTGLRPGKETDQLCWKHLRKKKVKGGKWRYVITVPKETKTGFRYPVANDPAVTAVTQIQVDLMLNGIETEDDMAVFCSSDGEHVRLTHLRRTFYKALKAWGHTHDEKGQKYCPYSLRHTYATFQLIYNKVSVFTLAKQMGCTVRMIQDHYGKLTPEMAMEELTDKSADDALLEEGW